MLSQNIQRATTHVLTLLYVVAVIYIFWGEFLLIALAILAFFMVKGNISSFLITRSKKKEKQEQQVRNEIKQNGEKLLALKESGWIGKFQGA